MRSEVRRRIRWPESSLLRSSRPRPARQPARGRRHRPVHPTAGAGARRTRVPAGIPEPIRSLASWFAGIDRQTGMILLGSAIFRADPAQGHRAGGQRPAGGLDRGPGRSAAPRPVDRPSALTLDYPFFLKNDPVRLTRILSTDSWFVLEATRSLLSLIPAAAGLLAFSVLLALLNLSLFIAVVIAAALVQCALYLAERRQQRLSSDFTASHHVLWERLLTIVQAPRTIRYIRPAAPRTGAGRGRHGAASPKRRRRTISVCNRSSVRRCDGRAAVTGRPVRRLLERHVDPRNHGVHPAADPGAAARQDDQPGSARHRLLSRLDRGGGLAAVAEVTPHSSSGCSRREPSRSPHCV